MSVWHKIGGQLRHPKGRMGRLAGHVMRWLNAKPNRLAIAGLSIQPSDRILELGFGPGEALADMVQLASSGKIYGIDASPTMLAHAKWRNRRAVARGQVSLQHGELSSFAFADESLDKILAVNVVYFWQKASVILAECHRVLRPGGRISIYATDASSMRRWKFASSDTHVHYTAEGLRSELLKGGFASSDIHIENVNMPAGIKGLLAIGQKSSASPLSSNN